jgi:uncharacterized repeat protein (TIGR01451 family)
VSWTFTIRQWSGILAARPWRRNGPLQRAGFRILGLTGLGLMCLMSQTALAVTNSSSLALARTFDKTVAVTNSRILVTATLTNTSSDALRGFFYFDEIPTGLTVTNISVTLGGLALTNFSFESGLDGDVYAGCTPWRLWLETPTNFAEANPVPPQSAVQILFSISCASTGVFSLQQFGFAACKPDKTNALYGYSGTGDQQTVSFAANSPSASLASHVSNGGSTVMVRLDSPPGYSYVLLGSTNLLDWVPLVTNTSPFRFAETNILSHPARFYRGLWLR